MVEAKAAAFLVEARSLFDSVDTDGSGELDRSETVLLFKKVYQQSGLSRSKKRVEREVDSAMLEFDTNGDGLSYCEMITLMCKSGEFAFGYDEDLIREVYHQLEVEYGVLPAHHEVVLAARMQAAAATLRSGALQQEKPGRMRSSSRHTALRASGNYAEVLDDIDSLVDIPDSEPVRMLAASAALEAVAMRLNTRVTAKDVGVVSVKMLCCGAVLRGRAAQVESRTATNQGEAGVMTAAATMIETGARALKQRFEVKADKAMAVTVIQANAIGMLVRQETRKNRDAAAVLQAGVTGAAARSNQGMLVADKKAQAAAALVRELRAKK